MPSERAEVVAVIECSCRTLSLRWPWCGSNRTVAKNRIGNIRAVALVGARPCRIDFADSGVEAVVGERIGRRARIRNASDPVFVVVG